MEVAGPEADLYRAILCQLALVEDDAAFQKALELSLSNKGLYRQCIRGEFAEPAVCGVYR